MLFDAVSIHLGDKSWITERPLDTVMDLSITSREPPAWPSKEHRCVRDSKAPDRPKTCDVYDLCSCRAMGLQVSAT
jgi:hypothetical protein